MCRAGCDSKMLVASKQSDDPNVIEVSSASLWRKVQLKLSFAAYSLVRRYLGAKTTYSPDLLGIPSSALLPLVKDTDTIHLHWIAGFLTSRQIRHIALQTGAPIVWTLMDIAPLTGGCHYAYDCQGYTQRCGRCPQIHSNSSRDISRWSWQRKKRYLGNLPITIVAPTQWVVDRVKESSLFGNNRIVRIPLGIDTEIFRPLDARLAREILRLPQDKKIIFFGAASQSDERKGMPHLIEALGYLAVRLREHSPELGQEVVVVMAGRRGPDKAFNSPFPSYQLGYLYDDRSLALAYQAADVFVCPSIEDAGPIMIPEAMMCGTPVVAFDTGGAPDLIKTMKTGYLASRKDSSDLANGIYALLFSSNLLAMRAAACEAATRLHALSVVARQYLVLYRLLTELRDDAVTPLRVS